jgi:hypothetical protein
MNLSYKKTFTEKLGLDFSNENDNIWLKNSMTLRKWIGILGMFLPLLLWLFLYVSTGLREPLDSISHYYYTRVDSIFIIIMGIIALFLIIYSGPKAYDFYVSSLAGLSALVLLLFPTSTILKNVPSEIIPYTNTILVENLNREYLHYASAAVFLLCLAVMSLFFFTKSNETKATMGVRKKIRNRIYIICGTSMILALLVMFISALLIRNGSLDEELYNSLNMTFWMETLAVESFGISWLVKGETLFPDLKR